MTDARPPRATTAAPPLHGLRVLDFSRVVAGPFCTMQLADLGAEIVKVEEREHGDDARGLKPPAAGGESHFYLAFNRTKKSVTIDIRRPAGQELIHGLAARSDVLVENFRPGVMQRFGLDYESLRARCPRLIYCSISAYGREGALASRPGFDPVLQAESGMMSVTGEAEGDPLRHPLAIVDTFTAQYATAAILAAVIARQASGRGQHIDLSLLDCSIAALANVAEYYLTSGQNPARVGNAHPSAVPAGLFKTKTGSLYLASAMDRLFAKLCREVLDRPDLLADPRFATNAARVVNREALFAILDAIFASDTRERWLARLGAAGLPAGAVRTVSEALESEEVSSRGMVVTVDHPTAGALRIVGSPFRFSESDLPPAIAPPLLGQHTAEVLRDLLGLDETALAGLREAKVIGGA